MGGMLAATFLAIFFVPMFFKLITDRHLTEKRSTSEIKAEVEHHKKAIARRARLPLNDGPAGDGQAAEIPVPAHEGEPL
jgi:hypothetical protein